MPVVSIDEAKELLAQRESLLIFPTETVYGIGCSALSSQAVELLLNLKDRSLDSGVPVLLATRKHLEDIVLDRNAQVQSMRKELLDKYWPGPLTVVIQPKDIEFAPGVCANDGSIALRLSSSPLACELALAAGGYLIATSANQRGCQPICSTEEGLAEFPGIAILPAEFGQEAKPSTILDLRCYPPKVIRKGAVDIV